MIKSAVVPVDLITRYSVDVYVPTTSGKSSTSVPSSENVSASITVTVYVPSALVPAPSTIISSPVDNPCPVSVIIASVVLELSTNSSYVLVPSNERSIYALTPMMPVLLILSTTPCVERSSGALNVTTTPLIES